MSDCLLYTSIEEAKEYLLKTLEYNSSDIEAYKLLTKICLKSGETEEILEILSTRIDKGENGDLYYCLARVYKYIGDSENYCANLEHALDNPYTLSFSKKIVKQELEYIKEMLGRNAVIEPETSIEEYSEEEPEEDEDFEEESEYDDEADEYEEDEDYDDDGEEDS